MGYLKQPCPPAPSGVIWGGLALSGGRFRLKFSKERRELMSDACPDATWPGSLQNTQPKALCLQGPRKQSEAESFSPVSPPPGSLGRHSTPEKPLGTECLGTGPSMPVPFCAVLSLDDFREGEGGAWWMLQPPHLLL